MRTHTLTRNTFAIVRYSSRRPKCRLTEHMRHGVVHYEDDVVVDCFSCGESQLHSRARGKNIKGMMRRARGAGRATEGSTGREHAGRHRRTVGRHDRAGQHRDRHG
eukprot:scaffold152222_cov35-Tisochrysis_lutea.AAC.3